MAGYVVSASSVIMDLVCEAASVASAAATDVAQTAQATVMSYKYQDRTKDNDKDDFPVTDEPVWLLGVQYSAKYDLDELRDAVQSRLWFTYRKDFPVIGSSGMTSDQGWGCMLRCGQMVVGSALLNLQQGSSWSWSRDTRDPNYLRVVEMFQDIKSAPYSIHQIALMGESVDNKPVGTWFGPNTVAQAIRKLSHYDEWNHLAVYVALDNTLVMDEVRATATNIDSTEQVREADDTDRTEPERDETDRTGPARDETDRTEPAGDDTDRNELARGENDRTEPAGGESATTKTDSREEDCDATNCDSGRWWRPLLLFIPLRLGLTEINPVYVRGLKACFTVPHTLGVIGGRPNHALYMLGHVGDEIVYLDPHITQATAPVADWREKQTEEQMNADATYHASRASRMHISELDPSLSLCFLCKTEAEFDDLCHRLHELLIQGEKTPLFEICTERPAHMLGMEPTRHLNIVPDGATGTDYEKVPRHFDSDDEFEIL